MGLTQAFPDPSKFETTEHLAMEYNKQYGKFELIRQYNQFINEQTAVLENLTKIITENEETGY